MATPVGHSLIALVISYWTHIRGVSTAGWVMFGLVAASAPDLDFIPGLLIGDVNRFHHGASHSLGAALVFGAATGLLAGGFAVSRKQVMVVATLLYTSHLAVDLLTVDTNWPYGQPLFWPLSQRHFAISSPPLWGIRHGSPDGGLLLFLEDVFSSHNLRALFRELFWLGPPVFVFWLSASRMRRSATTAGAADGQKVRSPRARRKIGLV